MGACLSLLIVPIRSKQHYYGKLATSFKWHPPPVNYVCCRFKTLLFLAARNWTASNPWLEAWPFANSHNIPNRTSYLMGNIGPMAVPAKISEALIDGRSPIVDLRTRLNSAQIGDQIATIVKLLYSLMNGRMSTYNSFHIMDNEKGNARCRGNKLGYLKFWWVQQIKQCGNPYA